MRTYIRMHIHVRTQCIYLHWAGLSAAWAAPARVRCSSGSRCAGRPPPAQCVQTQCDSRHLALHVPAQPIDGCAWMEHMKSTQIQRQLQPSNTLQHAPCQLKPPVARPPVPSGTSRPQFRQQYGVTRVGSGMMSDLHTAALNGPHRIANKDPPPRDQ
jgi:hypothetical protein